MLGLFLNRQFFSFRNTAHLLINGCFSISASSTGSHGISTSSFVSGGGSLPSLIATTLSTMFSKSKLSITLGSTPAFFPTACNNSLTFNLNLVLIFYCIQISAFLFAVFALTSFSERAHFNKILHFRRMKKMPSLRIFYVVNKKALDSIYFMCRSCWHTQLIPKSSTI